MKKVVAAKPNPFRWILLFAHLFFALEAWRLRYGFVFIVHGLLAYGFNLGQRLNVLTPVGVAVLVVTLVLDNGPS